MNLLPDDVERYLLKGQRRRAAYALIQQRWISYHEALVEIDRWLPERDLRQPLQSTDCGAPHEPGRPSLPILEVGAVPYPLPPI